MADTPDNKPKNPWGTPPRGGNSQPQPSGGMADLEALLHKLKEQLGGGGQGSGGNGTGGNGQGFAEPPQIIMLFLAGLAAFWVISGFFRVEPGEQAVVQRFGAYQRLETQPGLRFALPWPIDKVTKVNASLDRRLQIGFTNTGNEEQTDVEEESQMLTSDANIVDFKVAILWNITEANKFIFNIRDPENTIKQVGQSAIREVVGQTPLQSIINEGRDDVARRIRDAMQETLKSYDAGVNISQVLILQNTVHPEVLEAFKDVVAAKQDAERFQNEAMIYKNDILPKARGEAAKMLQEAEAYKQTQVTKATGDANRFKAIVEAYQQGRDVTKDRIYIETMEGVLAGAQKIIVDPGTGGIVPYLPLSAATKAEKNTDLGAAQ